jgi:branched-chain amino acid transport system ATP-binding protein
VLRIEQLSLARGGAPVLREVDLVVEAGELVALLGASGAGKSALLRCVSRLEQPGTGRIELEGVDLSRLAPHRVAELGLVHVPQGRRIFPQLTVLENLRLGAHPRPARRQRAHNLERVFALFPHLAGLGGRRGAELSGGEQQLVALARGLMGSPRLLLLDEPSAGLSPLLARSLLEAVAEIHRQGTTVLLAQRDARPALRLAHRACVLEAGRVALEGPCTDLLADERVRQAYLGTPP